MSFPPGTEMFQFPGFASTPYVFRCRSPCGGVSPFGHPRINDRSHLPAAFRSVPRPSSPLGAKASTERSYRAQYFHPHTHAGPSPAPLWAANQCPAIHTLKSNQPIRFTCQTARHRPVTRTRPAAISSCSSRCAPKPAPQRQAQETKTMETVGFEPTTLCLQSRCSPTELRPRELKKTTKRLQAAPRSKAAQVARLSLRGIPSRNRESMGQGGLEPPTPRLSSVCSNQLSYWPTSQRQSQTGSGKPSSQANPASPTISTQARMRGQRPDRIAPLRGIDTRQSAEFVVLHQMRLWAGHSATPPHPRQSAKTW